METQGTITGWKTLLSGIGLVLLGVAVLVWYPNPARAQQSVQEHVHHMAHTVMPFDMAKTLHIFKMTEQGGVEKVVVRDAKDSDQVALIRQHLGHEAMRFQHGDYSDPAKLHGADMPGLKDLAEDAAQVKVTYADLPGGGQITFETKSLHLLTAIHRWFGAQLSEHGADAKAE